MSIHIDVIFKPTDNWKVDLIDTYELPDGWTYYGAFRSSYSKHTHLQAEFCGITNTLDLMYDTIYKIFHDLEYNDAISGQIIIKDSSDTFDID
jgi:hypothetical protein